MLIKQACEDFIVKEISDVQIRDSGKYAYFTLTKNNYNTLDAIQRIADALNISFSKFGFAGNKDKKAITEQLVSIEGSTKNLKDLSLKDIKINIVGFGDSYISIGDLKGNEFIITVRDLSNEELINFHNKTQKKPILLPNIFGEQRFSYQNVDVGRAILKRDFIKAAELLHLDIINNDYIGALRKINKKILRLYVHSFQSHIFNETVKRYKKPAKIPIVGFGTELEDYDKELQNIIQNILNEEKISLRDFITLKMPELSQEGGIRDSHIEIENLEVINKTDDTITLKFFLKKGSYATVAIDYLFKD
ncbi:MAG: tRNA pseudouridine(13) synthase TruD [Nanoarchaeota archaeon]